MARLLFIKDDSLCEVMDMPRDIGFKKEPKRVGHNAPIRARTREEALQRMRDNMRGTYSEPEMREIESELRKFPRKQWTKVLADWILRCVQRKRPQ